MRSGTVSERTNPVPIRTPPHAAITPPSHGLKRRKPTQRAFSPFSKQKLGTASHLRFSQPRTK